MDDLAKILVEVSIGQANKVVQSVLWNISLPLKFTYGKSNSRIMHIIHISPIESYVKHIFYRYCFSISIPFPSSQMVLKFACLSIHVQNDSLSFKFSVGTDAKN